MKKSKDKGISKERYLRFEDSFIHGDLLEIETNRKFKKENTLKLRKMMPISAKDEKISKIKGELVDVAIVLYLGKNRYKSQDLDNVSKIILDAIKKNGEDDKEYFIEDDRQVARLLLYKKQRIEDAEAETSQISISIRKHDPQKEMTLVEV